MGKGMIITENLTVTLDGTTYTRPVLVAIAGGAVKHELPFDLLVCLGMGESDMDEFAESIVSNPPAGQQAEASYGIFQINTMAHGGSKSTWTGVEGTVRAMNQMAARWQSAFAACGGWPAWHRNRSAFLSLFWPAAQGSIAPQPHQIARAESLGTALALQYWESETAALVRENELLRQEMAAQESTMEASEERFLALQVTDERYRVELDDLNRRLGRLEGVSGKSSNGQSFFSRFASRKFLMATFGPLLAVAASRLGVDADIIAGCIALVVAGILGIAYEDGKRTEGDGRPSA